MEIPADKSRPVLERCTAGNGKSNANTHIHGWCVISHVDSFSDWEGSMCRNGRRGTHKQGGTRAAHHFPPHSHNYKTNKKLSRIRSTSSALATTSTSTKRKEIVPFGCN
ncbi:uncharacterized protein LOC142586904 isoform X1 [Dermacentor variabilis]|uniref:uncharacterized protein LOC142586904 isoform X1 n=1 Tax=Dermacentor variabilis TaxID=34621 RepID=UPI003F5B68F4